jgi:hypothetical protein
MSQYSGYSSVFSYNDGAENGQQPPQQQNYDNHYREEERPNISSEQHQRPTYAQPQYQPTDENVKHETHKNIKLLKDVVNVSVEKPRRSSSSKKKPKHEEYDQSLDAFVDYIRDPLIMIALYVIMHSEAVNDFLSSYLPSNYNNPVNIVKYYGARGFVYVVVFYVFRNYKK